MIARRKSESSEFFTLNMLHDLIDDFLKQWEVDRLAHFYGTYRTKAYRAGYLNVLLDGTVNTERDAFKKQMLIERALGKRKKPFDELTSKEKGKLSQEHSYKLRTIAIRVLFLREFCEDRSHARRKIIEYNGEQRRTSAHLIAGKLETYCATCMRDAPDAEAIRKMCRFR